MSTTPSAKLKRKSHGPRTDCHPDAAGNSTAQLVHTHVWHVEVPFDRLPLGCAQHLSYKSPDFPVYPEMQLRQPSVELTIDIDYKNGHQLRLVPPEFPNNDVTFYTTLTTLRLLDTDAGNDNQTSALMANKHLLRSKAHGLITPDGIEIPTLRAHPEAAVVALRHCAVYHNRPSDWFFDTVLPRRTWQRSRLQPATVLHRTEPDVRLVAPTSYVPQPMHSSDFLVPRMSGHDKWQLFIERIRTNNLDHLVVTVELPDDFDLGDSAPVLAELRSVSQPHVSMLFDVPAGSMAGRHREQICDATVLELLNDNEPFEFTLSTQRMHMMSTQSAREWYIEDEPMHQYFNDMLALVNQQRMSPRHDMQLQLVDDEGRRGRPIPVHRALLFRHFVTIRPVVSETVSRIEIAAMTANSRWWLAGPSVQRTAHNSVFVVPIQDQRHFLWPVLVRALYMGRIENIHVRWPDVLELLAMSERLQCEQLIGVCVLWLVDRMPVSQVAFVKSVLDRVQHVEALARYESTVRDYGGMALAVPELSESRQIQRHVRQMQRIYRPLINCAEMADMRWRAHGHHFEVHTFMLEARAPAMRGYLEQKYQHRRRPYAYDVSGLGLSVAGIHRLLGHIYCGDEVEDGDDALQLLAVATLLQLEHLANAARESLLQELDVEERWQCTDWIEESLLKALEDFNKWTPRSEILKD